MELNAGEILVSSNVTTKSPLEPAGDKLTNVYGMWILTHVEFMHTLMFLPIIYMQHPIQIDTYIILVSK